MGRLDVREYLEERIGVRSTSSSSAHGPQLVCDCPLCGKSSRFYVAENTGAWHCFRCGESGGLLRLVQVIDGLTGSEAKEFLSAGETSRVAPPTVGELRGRLPGKAKRWKTRTEKERDIPEEAPHESGLPPEFIPIWDPKERLWSVPRYLKDRGITARTAATYGLGYCQEGRYAGRLILPVHIGGRVISFQGRLMGPGEPRYLGPPKPKGAILYGYDEALGGESVIVCEGPMDVLALHQHGQRAVGLMGKVISLAQAVALKSGGFSRITVMLDPEASAEGAEVVRVLSSILPDVRQAILPDGKDPAEASRAQVLESLASSFAPNFRTRLNFK